MDSILGLVIAAFIFGPPAVAGYGLGWFVRGRRDRQRTNVAISDAQQSHAAIEQIRHDAYEHMTLDPASLLPPIIVDTIRSYDRQRQQSLATVGTDAATYDPTASQPFAQLRVEPHPTHQEYPPRVEYPPRIGD